MALDPVRVDVLVTWLGAAGTFSYLAYLLRNRGRSLLESRTLALLLALGMLLLVRGFYWLEIGSTTLLVLTFIPATLLPLAMCLFVEGLLRRHLPRWLKVLGAGTTAIFFLLNVVGLLWVDRRVSLAFPLALLLVMACLGWVLVTRDRAALSPAENRLVRGCVTAVMLGLPLAASDFRLDLGWPSHRWGAVATLAFVLTLARMTEVRETRSWLSREIPWLVAKTLFLAGIVRLLSGGAEWAAILPPTTALVLLFALWERLRALAVLRRERGLLRWLAEAPADSLGAFVEALREYPLTEQHVLLGPAELEGYHPDALRRLFRGPSRVCSAAELRQARSARGGDAAALDAAEQMLDALGRHEMTHACLLAADPLRLLLVNLPEITGGRDAELELEVIRRQGSLALAMEGTRGG